MLHSNFHWEVECWFFFFKFKFRSGSRLSSLQKYLQSERRLERLVEHLHGDLPDDGLAHLVLGDDVHSAGVEGA